MKILNEILKAFYICIIIVLVSGLSYVLGMGDFFQISQPRSVSAAYTTKTMKVTAYCPCEKCCGQYADGITANGYKIQTGDKFCASDVPFGTIVEIPGYGKVPVLDRGGAIKGDRLDVYFDNHQDALNWGVKFLKVKIYGND